MEPTQQTIQEIDRAIHKIIAKYPVGKDAVLTDIHLEIRQETGDFLAYDDDDQELNRCVVEQLTMTMKKMEKRKKKLLI